MLYKYIEIYILVFIVVSPSITVNHIQCRVDTYSGGFQRDSLHVWSNASHASLYFSIRNLIFVDHSFLIRTVDFIKLLLLP